MGFLTNQNNEIIVDAILTKYGREKLAAGQQLGILKFALSDDEIDYTLYNTNHPLGSDFFDLAIRSLPLLEPVPNSANQFRYYLYSSTSQVAFTYTLVTSTPSQFFSGLNMVGASYTFGASVSPTPSNSSQVWYSLKFTNTPCFTIIGNVVGNPPQDLAKIIQTNGGTTVVNQDSIIAYGNTFTLTVNSVPTDPRTFTVVMDAANVVVAPRNIQISLNRNPLEINI